MKFWDASGCNLLFLYKLRTNRLFDRVQHAHSTSVNAGRDGNPMSKFDTKASRTNSSTADEQVQQQINLLNISSDSNAHENPFAIYSVKMCCDGKYLIAAARGGHATLFKFTGSELDKADEGLGDLSFLEIPILHRNLINDHDEMNSSGNSSNANEQPSRQSTDKKVSLDTALSLQRDREKDCLLCRISRVYFERRWATVAWQAISLNSFAFFHGCQAIECLFSLISPSIRNMACKCTNISHHHRSMSIVARLIFGLDNGLVVVDFLSQSILMNMATADLYGTMDPFHRTTTSPKRRGPSNDSNNDDSTASDYQVNTSSFSN